MARELFSLLPLSRLSFSLLLLSLFTFRLQPIPAYSPPPFLPPLPITYTRSLPPTLTLPSHSLPIPAYSPPPLPMSAPSLLFPFRPPPILSPPSDERVEGYPILLMREGGGAGDSHIPLTPRGKSEGRDRNKIPEATYPLWGTLPRVDLWGRVRTWGNGGYFFAFFIPSR